MRGGGDVVFAEFNYNNCINLPDTSCHFRRVKADLCSSALGSRGEMWPRLIFSALDVTLQTD